MSISQPTRSHFLRSRTGAAVSLAAVALSLGAGALSGVISPANASTQVSSFGHHRTPTPTPAPTSTPAPAPSTTLNPGPAPTTVAASVPRKLLGTVQSINDGTVTVTVTTAGRYTLQYDSTLPAAFNNVVDGVFLQQVGAGSNATVYSQTFFLSVGQHTVRLGGPQVFGPAKEYLDGPLG